MILDKLAVWVINTLEKLIDMPADGFDLEDEENDIIDE